MPAESRANPSEEHPHPNGSGRLRAARRLLLLFGVVSLAIAIGGYCYYREQTREIRSDKYNELKAIAGLKVDQIVERRNARLADARTFSKSVLLRSAIGRWARARRCLPEERNP